MNDNKQLLWFSAQEKQTPSENRRKFPFFCMELTMFDSNLKRLKFRENETKLKLKFSLNSLFSAKMSNLFTNAFRICTSFVAAINKNQTFNGNFQYETIFTSQFILSRNVYEGIHKNKVQRKQQLSLFTWIWNEKKNKRRKHERDSWLDQHIALSHFIFLSTSKHTVFRPCICAIQSYSNKQKRRKKNILNKNNSIRSCV